MSEKMRDFNCTTTHSPEVPDSHGACSGSAESSCIHQLFEEMAQRTPEAAAVKSGSRFVTYRDLNERANRLAHRLIQLGIKEEFAVGIHLERSIEMIVALLAILKAGGACLPLDPAYPPERLEFMMADGQPAAILIRRADADQWRECGAQLLCVEAELETNSPASRQNPANSVAPENLAYLLYTSGSTGRPKAVAMEHRAFCNLLRWQIGHWKFPAAARTLQFASLSFDVAFQEIFSTLGAGGTLVLVSDEIRRDPAALLQFVQTEAIERLFLPFVALQQFATIAGLERVHLPSLREIITAGERLKITPEVKGFFIDHHECVLQNQYGPTETHVVAASTLQGDPGRWPPLPPIGHPITGTTIHILDESLRPVPLGKTGELYIGGVCLARGYLRQPEQTQKRFLADPFAGDPDTRLYKSGDLARYLPDGSIAFVSRSDDQIKIRGVRIELGEIEVALSQHPAVQHAAVTGVDDSANGMRLIAYFVAKPGQRLADGELRSFLSAKLPEPMIPTAFVGLDKIPLTPSGKLDRRALPAPAALRTQPVRPPRGPLEQELVSIFEDVLKVRPIGIDDSFFELGGHSLLAAQVAVAVAERCRIRLPTSALFQCPTIEALAERLGRMRASDGVIRIVALNESGPKPPFFCVPPLLDLARHLGADQPFYGLELWKLSEPATDAGNVIGAIASDCLESIRTVQSRGPYYLGGHSFGGPVAFEIARRLESMGEEVELLVLIEPDPPKASLTAVFGRHVKTFVQRLLLTPDGAMTHYFQAILRRTSRGVLATRDFSALQPEEKMMHLDGTYRAVKIRSHITLILATDPQVLNSKTYRPNSEPRLDWSNFAGNGIDIQRVPGDHFSITGETHVHALAACLRASLSRAVGDRSGAGLPLAR